MAQGTLPGFISALSAAASRRLRSETACGPAAHTCSPAARRRRNPRARRRGTPQAPNARAGGPEQRGKAPPEARAGAPEPEARPGGQPTEGRGRAGRGRDRPWGAPPPGTAQGNTGSPQAAEGGPEAHPQQARATAVTGASGRLPSRAGPQHGPQRGGGGPGAVAEGRARQPARQPESVSHGGDRRGERPAKRGRSPERGRARAGGPYQGPWGERRKDERRGRNVPCIPPCPEQAQRRRGNADGCPPERGRAPAACRSAAILVRLPRRHPAPEQIAYQGIACHSGLTAAPS